MYLQSTISPQDDPCSYRHEAASQHVKGATSRQSSHLIMSAWRHSASVRRNRIWVPIYWFTIYIGGARHIWISRYYDAV
eukprot:6185518-Pleurochrysis_carterae.AAC.3